MKKLFVVILMFLSFAGASYTFWRFQEPPSSKGSLSSKKMECVSYTPFVEGEAPWQLTPKSVIPSQRVEKDLQLLSQHFHCIRIYSITGMDYLPTLAEQYGLKILFGIWINSDPVATQTEIQRAISIINRHPQVVKGIIVGNETLLRKEVTPNQLIASIQKVKEHFPHIPVTYADVWEFWLKYPEIAPAVDFITIHILPYWEDEPASIEEAISHVQKIYEKLKAAYPEKEIIIGETGWPSQGRMREGALPSLANQKRFIKGFVSLAEEKGYHYNIIEAFDQPWKRYNEGTVGGYWGLFSSQREDKGFFNDQAVTTPTSSRAKKSFLFSILFSILSVGFVYRKIRGTSIKDFMALGSVILVASLCLPLQQEIITVSSRNAFETWWSVFLLAASTTYYFFFLYAYSTRQVLLHRPYQWTKRLIDALVLLCTLALVFDGRYREFPNYIFAAPVMGLTILTFRDGRIRDKGSTIDNHVGWLLGIFALITFLQEGVLNWQSNIWVALNLTLAFTLLPRNIPTPSFKVIKIMVLSYVLAALIRFHVMESVTLSNSCAETLLNTTMPLSCQARDFLGMLIHYKAWAWFSLLLVGANVFIEGSFLPRIALASSVFGLVLYQVDLASIAFLFSLIQLLKYF